MNAVGWRAVTCGVSGMLLAGAVATAAWAEGPDPAADPGNDWVTYHGTYKSWHYSPLDQINADNIKKLQIAWMHQPGRSTRGLQSMPLVYDGVLYYSGSYSRLYALDGATGKVLWSYIPKLNEDLIATQTHTPYNRGIGLGQGHVYVGTVDGRLIAVDMKTGKPAWDTKLIDSEKLTVGFTGAPLVVKDKVIIGAQGGEWPYRGPIFGVDGATGKKIWEFYTSGGTPEAQKTWGNDTWKIGGGGGWMPGAYDPETNTVVWGTANPDPLYDWAGPDWKTKGPRPGDNLYTSSVIGLDPDTGKLKNYFQTLPHDQWDFDDSPGEFVFIEKDGQKYIVHPNKGGYIYVFDRNLGFKKAWNLVENSNFIKGVDDKGGLIGRQDLAAGKHENLCPAIAGGVSWNSGTYNPKTGYYYKVGNEWCMNLEVLKTTPVVEPNVQLNMGANFTIVPPKGGKISGHVDARDPITGKKAWQIDFPYPPLSSLLSTGGNLLFVPDAAGVLHAYDATTGKELWSHNDGIGHNGGIISYSVNGKQYIALMNGWNSLVGEGYKTLFGEPFVSMPTDTGTLIVYSLSD